MSKNEVQEYHDPVDHTIRVNIENVEFAFSKFSGAMNDFANAMTEFATLLPGVVAPIATVLTQAIQNAAAAEYDNLQSIINSFSLPIDNHKFYDALGIPWHIVDGQVVPREPLDSWLEAGDLPERFEYQERMRRFWFMLPVNAVRVIYGIIINTVDYLRSRNHDDDC